MNTDRLQKLQKHRYLFALTSSVVCALISFAFFYLHCRMTGESLVTLIPHLILCCLLILFYSLTLLHIIKAAGNRIAAQEKLIEENQRQLAEAEKEMMRANLLRAVSHDLRTPLTGIIGNSLAYLENSAFLEPADKDALVRNIYTDSSWLLNMVENLLTVTRIKDRNLAINTSDESVEEVIGEALQKMRQRHPDFEISVTFPEDLLIFPMDAILIEQVTINLLENALYHARSTDPVEVIVENHRDHVSFTIRDYGTGIPEDKLVHLFDGSDYVADASDSIKGMGIGLVICKTIIAAHHGTLIGRNHDRGAEFIFTLPKKKEGTNES